MRTHQTSQKQSLASNSLVSHPFAVQPKPQEIAESSGTQEYASQMPDFAIFNPAGERSPVQPKLAIGAPGDKYEQEADRTAKLVVQRINGAAIARSTPEPLIQRRGGMEGGEASTDLESAITSARSGGQPLDAGLQERMSAVMGTDFSGVRVHADAQSDELNRSIQARAFTTGQDVFFRQGEYQPGSRGGQELIAHELTHVVQQTGVMAKKAPDFGKQIKKIWSGIEEIQRALDGTQVSGIQQSQYGLVAIDWDAGNNQAGAHVHKAGEGEHLDPQDMLAAVNDIYQALTVREQNGGPAGTVIIEPQGAAVVKSVVELLGASLGGTWGKVKAFGLRQWRKTALTVEKNKSGVIDKAIVPEHIAWLKALEGQGVNILPLGLNEPNMTIQKFTESIVSGSALGKQRLEAYEDWINHGQEVGLQIQLTRTQLLSIIQNL